MNFYEFAWYTFHEVTRLEPGDAKILIQQTTPNPLLGRGSDGLWLSYPRPIKCRPDLATYQGLAFNPENEHHNRIIWSLFKSAVYYLSFAVQALNPRLYASQKPSRDLVTLSAIHLVEDAVITAYLKAQHRAYFSEITYSNAVCYVLLKPVQVIVNPGERFLSTVLSGYKNGLIKGDLTHAFQSDVETAVRLLRTLEHQVTHVLPSSSQKDENNDTINAEIATIKIQAVQELSSQLEHYASSIHEVPAYHYMNHPTSCTAFTSSHLPSERLIDDTLQKMMKLGTVPVDIDVKFLRNEGNRVLWEWIMKEKSRAKLLSTYRQLGEATRFKDIMYPEEDYAEFFRRKKIQTRSIRRITNRLSTFYNFAGEDYRRESGILDLQEAIQVVANASPRTDVFVEDQLNQRRQLWAILIDISSSLKAFAGEVKDIILCLAEVANKLFLDKHAFGIFAFDDNFYLIKDFTETYSNTIRARIGGVKHGLPTYLPDGVTLVHEAIKKRYEEYKVVIVVTDGYPAGYSEINDLSKQVITQILKSGVYMIGIGVNSQGVKRYFPVNCVVQDTYELMKSFIKIYFQYVT